ncbi:ArsR/SmtB family transcription factor [Alteribacter natronophilus]|uniref:ArsR/SmtB family transcription factor n=1 Tax=Alteribacter natronophilus TaxID=2583810 RepID=UPI0014862BDC|nr:metalloregulator ArsR/SmtB family transcription factor [Alteribacter natronophilus]
MKMIDTTFARSTYEVTVDGSFLYEAALGIAVITYPEIHPSLERDGRYWKKVKEGLSEELKTELAYAQEHNTWKVLLDLIAESGCRKSDSFAAYVEEIGADELKERAFPYLGVQWEEKTKRAVRGDDDAVQKLLNAVDGHLFFPGLIRYLAEVDGDELRRHILKLTERWFREVMDHTLDETEQILNRDLEAKRAMQDRLDPEAFVTWALGGEDGYPPEPSVTNVLLVPQVSYRPWVIQAERPGTKVFFYPVADESLLEADDVYKPPMMLVQKYKALGDETRLRIVKHLSESELSLKELTELLGMGKTTVHHHLRMLRSAKIVRTGEKGYRLADNFPGTEAGELEGYLAWKER